MPSENSMASRTEPTNAEAVPDNPLLKEASFIRLLIKTTVALEARSDNHDRFVFENAVSSNETRDSNLFSKG
ncbi:MAG: hypothetical protein ACLT9W_06805 [Streptococcus sp.]